MSLPPQNPKTTVAVWFPDCFIACGRLAGRLLCLAFMFHGLYGFAQPARFGNEWINPAQTYYKIPIATPGRYRITHTDLVRAGIALNTLNPNALQLFRRGQELPVTVSAGGNRQLGETDFIEFDGQRNDGATDSSLYRPPARQPHPHYSLFSDTAAYFLTWRLDGKPGLRELPLPGTKPAWEWADDLRLLTTDYPAGTIYPPGATYASGAILSSYDTGEGWTGPLINAGESHSQVFALTNPVLTAKQPQVEVLMMGRSVGNHRADVFANGRLLGIANWADNQTARLTADLLPVDLNPINSAGLSLTLTVQNGPESAPLSVSYWRVRYPQQPPATIPVLPVPALQRVVFQEFSGIVPNYIIITHPALQQPVGSSKNPVQAYATYRASAAGGGFDTLTATVTDLFNAFSYGERSPLAIRRFMDFMLAKQPVNRPVFLFLIGQSRDPQGVRKNANAFLLDMIPNAGWPGSDVLLVDGLAGNSQNPTPENVPAVAIGRLNANQPQQVLDYLEKIREHETPDTASAWQRRVLHLSGGRSADELVRFRAYVDAFAAFAQQPPLSATVTTLGKQTDEPVEILPVVDPVNQGVALLTLFGHSSLDVADVDIGFASDAARGYANRGRYPFVFVNGCAAGNFFFGRPTFGTDWVLTPRRGAIGFLAHTYNGFDEPLRDYAAQFYGVLADSTFTNQAIGRIQQETIRRYIVQHQDIYAITNAQQITLQGDPAVRIFPKLITATVPEPTDRLAPLLDVAVDGRRLRNDDFVPARPVISVLIQDDAALSADTTTLTLLLQRPCPTGTAVCPFTKISLRSATLKAETIAPFSGTATPQNALRLTCQLPDNLPDGRYQLLVQGRDRAGNRAAPYQIAFRVQGALAVLESGVFPNPATGAPVTFWLTLAGAEPPAEPATLRVFDAGGRVVWLQEMPLRVGYNAVFWNPPPILAAGLYGYRWQLPSDFLGTADALVRGRILLVP